jgi:hypothetical protein
VRCAWSPRDGLWRRCIDLLALVWTQGRHGREPIDSRPCASPPCVHDDPIPSLTVPRLPGGENQTIRFLNHQITSRRTPALARRIVLKSYAPRALIVLTAAPTADLNRRAGLLCTAFCSVCSAANEFPGQTFPFSSKVSSRQRL